MSGETGGASAPEAGGGGEQVRAPACVVTAEGGDVVIRVPAAYIASVASAACGHVVTDPEAAARALAARMGDIGTDDYGSPAATIADDIITECVYKGDAGFEPAPEPDDFGFGGDDAAGSVGSPPRSDTA